MRKRWTLLPADEAQCAHLQAVLNIHPALCRLLVQRGITTFDEAKAFFRPDLATLHDPFLMLDMEAAVQRLVQALRKKERILLYGDYDVDGTTSVAMMHSFLSKHHQNLDYYIPDRYKEGYGVSMEGVDYAHQNGTSLIIAMDCGVQALAQVQQAKAFGIDFIICDHHLPGEALPEAVAVLDPKREGCGYPYKELSGCGVSFKLAQALSKQQGWPEEDLFELLDFLVLSIAADIVPMTGENRTLAFFGLQKLNRTERPGLQALIEQSGRELPLSISGVVFGLAPLINAAGRLADAQQAVRLMLSADKYVAADNVRVLEHRNKLRKEYDQSILKEAKELFEALPDMAERRSVLLFQNHWHKGVVGIAAARMVEHFHRPSILLTESNGKAVGSARSVPGFNIYEAIKDCEDLLLNFGGHDHAAGMTLEMAAVPEFQKRFEVAVRQRIDEQMRIPELEIHAVLDLKDITPAFWRVLSQFAPFGPENHNPVFATKNVVDSGHSRLLKGNHLRLSVIQDSSPAVTGIGFGMGDYFTRVSSKQAFAVAYKIEEEHWKGESYLRMMVQGVWG